MPLAERDQALARAARPGPSGGVAADERLLEAALALVEQRARERRAVAEAAEERALADAGLGGDRVHRRRCPRRRSANSVSAAARMRRRLRAASARSGGSAAEHGRSRRGDAQLDAGSLSHA